MALDQLLLNAILYVFIPLWLLAGFADWLCHRQAQISRNAGVKESLLHQLMLAELGLPLAAGLLLQINALLIGIMVAGFVAHEVTVWCDLRYASRHRMILPVEQIVHSFQELIPLLILSLIVFLHWEQFVALVTLDSRAGLELEWKRAPLPVTYLATLLTAAVLLVVLPFAEELWRCVHDEAARRQEVREGE
jgi:hypothetical protein